VDQNLSSCWEQIHCPGHRKLFGTNGIYDQLSSQCFEKRSSESVVHSITRDCIRRVHL